MQIHSVEINHLKLMQEFLLKAKRDIEFFAKQEGEDLTEHEGSNRCQMLYWFCMGLGEYLPVEYTGGISYEFERFLVNQVDVTMLPLIEIASVVRRSGIPSDEILQYLISLFRQVHKVLYPNTTLMHTTKNIQKNHEEFTRAFDGVFIHPQKQHIQMFNRLVNSFKSDSPKIARYLSSTLSEQMVADMCQVLFYIPMGVAQRLPDEVQWIRENFQSVLEGAITKIDNDYAFISGCLQKRGAFVEEIMPYLLVTFTCSYASHFPNCQIMTLS